MIRILPGFVAVRRSALGLESAAFAHTDSRGARRTARLNEALPGQELSQPRMRGREDEAIVDVVSDREPATTPGLRSLRPQPPRVVPLGHLWMTAFETRRLSAAAAALTAALAMFEFAAGREAHLALSARHMVPVALASSAGLCWGVLLTSLYRARQLLIHGVRCSARVTAVAASRAPSEQRVTRVRVRYLANLNGHEVRSSAVLRLDAHERPPAEGDELPLVCDATNPARHLVPRALGFALEGD